MLTSILISVSRYGRASYSQNCAIVPMRPKLRADSAEFGEVGVVVVDFFIIVVKPWEMIISRIIQK